MGTLNRLSLVGLMVLLLSGLMLAQDLKLLVEHDKDMLAGSVYRERRENIMKQIGDGAIAFFQSARPQGEGLYKQDLNLLYLSGFPEPNALLVLVPKGIKVKSVTNPNEEITVREILFVQPRNPRSEQWTGKYYGPEGAVALRGLAYALPNSDFAKMLPALLAAANPKKIYGRLASEEVPQRMGMRMGLDTRTLTELLQKKDSTYTVSDPTSIIQKMRGIKSPEEISLIEKSTHISALAHNQAMMSCEPGMHEFDLQAVYEYVFRKLGSRQAAYSSIVGAGENSLVLHYDACRRPINDGDIIVADCGAEYMDYASDITRTFPANGKFSPAQRQIYEIVLQANKAAIETMKSGNPVSKVSAIVDSIQMEGLVKIGILKTKDRTEYRKFAPHGYSHGVGLQVHDMGGMMYQPGMVYTMEPGLYVPAGSAGVDPKYYNIGVRIEDTVLITETGNKILSWESPKEIDAIEALMKKKGIGNQPIQ
ncbi:MAG: aminopeptidase P N-terminal domain-containing protein [bacterium]